MNAVRNIAVLRAGILLGASLVSAPLTAQAQEHIRPTQLLPTTMIRSLFHTKGEGRLMPARVLPLSAVQIGDESSGIHPTADTDTELYTQRYDIDTSVAGHSDGFLDVLWGFPTKGYDPANNMQFVLLASETTQTAAVSPNNTADIVFAQIGYPAQITHLRTVGGLQKVQNPGPGSNGVGSVAIIFFDGVDGTAANQPSTAKIAKDTSGNPASFVIRLTNATPIANITFNFDGGATPPIKITDPNGKFGVLIAKTDDTGNPNNSPTNVQWLSPIGGASGPNLAWEYANGDLTHLGLVTVDADANFNQGAFQFDDTNNGNIQTNPPLNFLYRIRGKKLDGTPPSVGKLQGNIRRRGVNPPNGGAKPESAPGFYELDSFLAGTSTFVRADVFYTQPSYNANGTLTVNYAIEGYPAGTYDFVLFELPIVHFVNNAATFNIHHNLNNWPFADFRPTVLPNVKINGASDDSFPATTLNARMERQGDISHDGVVGILDLGLLADSFGSVSGDSKFNPDADLTGGGANPPDGKINILDLGELADDFNTGNKEP
jgi:hypothetical protein